MVLDDDGTWRELEKYEISQLNLVIFYFRLSITLFKSKLAPPL
jgi:hypothetical protein